MPCRQLDNVFWADPEFNCFGCGQRNAHGLKLRFFVDDSTQEVFTRCTIGADHTSFSQVGHGGILATIVDEVSFWTLFNSIRRLALTSSIKSDFVNVVRPGQQIEVRGKIKERSGPRVTVDVVVSNERGDVCVRSSVVFFVGKAELMRKTLGLTDNGKHALYDQWLEHPAIAAKL
eukprot:TRINITY_DN2146_c0_g1_i2.p3 TRINITY_DN2146_c0_g1~~TRINITY_DN2146_c0_g1_i2.p3  ORF type:complete len:175 (-),score=58.79 TRINITY_DN2146_c0_g1_i2:210-734(-)